MKTLIIRASFFVISAIIATTVLYKNILKPIHHFFTAPKKELIMEREYQMKDANPIKRFGLLGCDLYQYDEKVTEKWFKVLKINKSILGSSCSYQSFLRVDQYLVVSVCNTPMGAGGGCAAGEAVLRTLDGEQWEDGTHLKKRNHTYLENLKTFKNTDYDKKWTILESTSQK